MRMPFVSLSYLGYFNGFSQQITQQINRIVYFHCHFHVGRGDCKIERNILSPL